MRVTRLRHGLDLQLQIRITLLQDQFQHCRSRVYEDRRGNYFV